LEEEIVTDIEARISPRDRLGNGRRSRGGFLTLVLLAIGFTLSRLAYHTAGVRFDASPIESFAQLLDSRLLQTQLAESLWFLHAQPPMYNLLTGLALKLAPGNPGAPLVALYTAIGFATAALLASILRELGLATRVAVLLALAFASTPAFVLYENWYFYPHLEQFFIIAAAWAILRSRGRPGAHWALAFACLAALVMTRSLFHPAFLVIAILAAIAVAPRGSRKLVVALAAGPLAIVLGWSLKNAILFGFFGTSSWGGNSAHRMMTESAPRERIEEWVQEGKLGPISLEAEFSPPGVYRRILGESAGHDRGVPALDQMEKPNALHNPVNYNHWIYPVASRAYASGALRILHEDPGIFRTSIEWTARRFLDPVTDSTFLYQNRGVIQRWARAEEALETSLSARVAMVIVLGAAIFALARRRVCESERLFVLSLVGTVLWIAASGIALEYGENNRFRYSTLAPLFVLGAVAVRDAVRALSGRWTRAPLLGE
jgi:hypothetical protein